jgi:hypothetical protein
VAALESQRHEAVGLVSCDEAHVRLLIEVAAADEGALVGPVHEVLPVGLVVLEELTVEFQVLSHLNNNIVCFNAWVPSARPEGKGAHCHWNIIDCSLLCMEVLQFNVSQLSILISWEQVDTTLWELEKEIAWEEFLVFQMLKFRVSFFLPFFLFYLKHKISRSNFEWKQ